MGPLDSIGTYDPYMMMNNIGNLGNYGNFNNDSTMTMPWMNPSFAQMFQPTYNSNLSTADQKKAKAEEAEKTQTEQAKKIEELKVKQEEVKKELDKVKPDEKKEKVGFWKGVGHLLNGVRKSVTNLVCDENGFSLKRTLTTVGVAAAAVALEVVTCGAATPYLVAAGVAMAGYQTTKGAVNLANAKTKEEKIHALEDIGEGAGGLTMAYFGGRIAKGAKAKKATKLAEGLTSEASKIEKFTAVEQEAINAIKATKGNKKAMQSALDDLARLTKNKEGYEQFNASLGSKINPKSNILKPEFVKAETKENFTKLAGQLKEAIASSTMENKAEKVKEVEMLILSLEKAGSKKEALNIITKAQKMAEEINVPELKGQYNELEFLLGKAGKDFKGLSLTARAKAQGLNYASTYAGNVKSLKGLTAIKERPNAMLFVTTGPNTINSLIKDNELDIKAQELAKTIEEKETKLNEVEENHKKAYIEIIKSLIDEAKIYNIKVDIKDIKVDKIDEMSKKIEEIKKQIKEAQAKE